MSTLPARAGLLLLAGALCFAGFLVPTTPVSGGGVTLEGFWLLQAGLALAVASFALRAPLRRSALLAALFVVGVAGQLQLTSPLWLQYLDLRPAGLGRGTMTVGALALVAQTVGVATFARGRLRPLLDGLRPLLTRRAVLVGASVFVLCAVHVTPFALRGPSFLPAYGLLLAATAGLFCLNALHVVLFAGACDDERAQTVFRRLTAWRQSPGAAGATTRRERLLPWALAAFVLVVSALVAVFVFDRMPHIPDEVGYLFGARCFAAGHLTVPVPPVAEAFDVYLLDVHDGRWFSSLAPGWPAVLSIGARAGVPWLVNPLLGALCVLLVHGLVRRLSDRGTAHVATLLVAASPWFVFLAASHMTHTVTLALLLGAWLLLAPPNGARSPLRAGAAGLLLGLMVTIRPLDGVLAGGFTGIWLLATVRPWPRTVLPFAAGCLLGSLWLLPFNAHFTGDPLVFPLNDYMDRLWYPGVNRLGFGADVGNVVPRWVTLDPLPGHGLPDVLINANQNLYNVNFELFGWATGSLGLLLVHLLFGKTTSTDRWMVAFALLVPVGFSLYWFSGGPDFGARYWFLMFFPCVWLAVRGVRTVTGMLRTRLGDEAAAGRVAAALALLVGTALLTFGPWRVAARYVEYRGYHGDYQRMLESGEFGRALVLVRSEHLSDANSALVLNPPLLDADRPIFARVTDDAMERELRAAFPDRSVVHVRGRSGPGDRARIVRRED